MNHFGPIHHIYWHRKNLLPDLYLRTDFDPSCTTNTVATPIRP